MQVSTEFITEKLRGSSQATVISVSADTRPTLRKGAIGGELDR